MRTWTLAETEILSTNYNAVSNERLAELLPYKTPLAIYKKAYKMGLRKSKDIEFLNRSLSKKGNKNPLWNGGKKRTIGGYVFVYSPDHRRADKGGYVQEHIVAFERATGISVPYGCCIHHLNGVKDDNRIENLCMMTQGAHTAMHHIGAKRSDATKARISKRAKERLADKRNHPCYKDIDIRQVQNLIDSGSTVTDACKAFGISRSTFYEKVRELKNA